MRRVLAATSTILLLGDGRNFHISATSEHWPHQSSDRGFASRWLLSMLAERQKTTARLPAGARGPLSRLLHRRCNPITASRSPNQSAAKQPGLKALWEYT